MAVAAYSRHEAVRHQQLPRSLLPVRHNRLVARDIVPFCPHHHSGRACCSGQGEEGGAAGGVIGKVGPRQQAVEGRRVTQADDAGEHHCQGCTARASVDGVDCGVSGRKCMSRQGRDAEAGQRTLPVSSASSAVSSAGVARGSSTHLVQMDDAFAQRCVLCAERRRTRNEWSAVGNVSIGEACRRAQITRAVVWHKAY